MLSKSYVYGYVENFLLGFSHKNQNNQTKCLDAVKAENKTFINIISKVVDLIKNNVTFERIINEAGLDIITVHGFAKNCNLLSAISLYKDLSIIDFDKLDFFQILLDYSDDLYVFFQITDLNDRAIWLGEYLANRTTFKIR